MDWRHHDDVERVNSHCQQTLETGLDNLVKSGLIQRPCRGIYVNPNAKSADSYTIEHKAGKITLFSLAIMVNTLMYNVINGHNIDHNVLKNLTYQMRPISVY